MCNYTERIYRRALIKTFNCAFEAAGSRSKNST